MSNILIYIDDAGVSVVFIISSVTEMSDGDKYYELIEGGVDILIPY